MKTESAKVEAIETINEEIEVQEAEEEVDPLDAFMQVLQNIYMCRFGFAESTWIRTLLLTLVFLNQHLFNLKKFRTFKVKFERFRNLTFKNQKDLA